MRTRPLVPALAAAAAIALAGCGGSETVTRTVTTDQLPTTGATPAPPATTTAPAPTSVGEERLPPVGAVADTRPGSVTDLDDAQAFVDGLYSAGDPSKPAARARLEAAGYADGLLRDEPGVDPESGIALFRTYAIVVRDAAAAQQEVDAAADEVVRTSAAAASTLSLPEVPGARALRLDVDGPGTSGSVVFVTFASGPYVYGLQGVSTAAATLPQDEVLGVARELYSRVSATP